MAKANRSFVVPAALVAAAAFLSPGARAAPPPLDVGEVINPCSLAIGPVEGLTRRWHIAPAHTAIPAAKCVYFVLNKHVDGNANWVNAFEVFEDRWSSIAIVPLGVPGDLEVRAELFNDDGLAATRSCLLTVSPVTPEEIQVLDILWSAADLGLSDPPTNEETVRAYFGESVAALSPMGEDVYATSVERTIVGEAVLSHPEFLPLFEWRINGFAQAIGPRYGHMFNDVGEYRFGGGPLDHAASADVRTYRTAITRHTDSGFIFDGVPVTYTAITDPPGYEKYVSWLASTKYGFTKPIFAAGPEFTTTFFDTYGWVYDGTFSWIGVRGDNAADGQDAKVVCPFSFRFDGLDHVIVDRVFMLVDPVMKISLDASAPGPVIIVAKDPGGLDIPESIVPLEPGGAILYGFDGAEQYVVRAPLMAGLPPGILCAVQPPLATNSARSFPGGCGEQARKVITAIRAVGTIRIQAEPVNAAGVDSGCPVTIEIVLVRAGMPDQVERTVTLTRGGPTAITYKNINAAATVEFRAKCEDGPGDCLVSFTGGFFLAAAAPPPPPPETEILPATTAERACATPPIHTINLGQEKAIYRVEITGPTGASATDCLPVISQDAVGGVSFPNRTVGPGETFIIEIDNRDVAKDASITYTCPSTPPTDCNLTYRVLENPTSAYPTVTVSDALCGPDRRPFISNAPGTYTFTVSVPATAPGGGAACPVTVKYRQWRYVASPGNPVGFGPDILPENDLQPGDSVTTVYTNPPATPPMMIVIEISCSSANPGTCNYSLSVSR